jgi:cytoskeletal protein RodZ
MQNSGINCRLTTDAMRRQAMATFGERLRRERETQGIRLEEIARATKIGVRFLEALERDDFDTLPGDVFARGYVRAYAEHLGIDPEELVEEYERESAGRRGTPEAGDDEVIREMSRILIEPEEKRPASGRPTIMWITGGLVILAAVLWLTFRRAPTPDPSSPQQIVQAVPAGAPEQQESVPESTERSIPPESAPESTPTPRRAEVTLPRDPESEPEPEPATVKAPEPRIRGTLTVPDHGVGTGVVNRGLVGAGERFPEGQQVWFWNRVLGGQAGETIRHVWLHEGREVAAIDLFIGGPHWRTQSRKTLRPGSVGRWTVEARDHAGAVLARQDFLCLSTEPP